MTGKAETEFKRKKKQTKRNLVYLFARETSRESGTQTQTALSTDPRENTWLLAKESQGRKTKENHSSNARHGAWLSGS
jgi:hypothetical protein